MTTEFTVTSTYAFAGDETDSPTNPTVEMLPSLDVNITARPLKPVVHVQRPKCTASPDRTCRGNHAHSSEHKAEVVVLRDPATEQSSSCWRFSVVRASDPEVARMVNQVTNRIGEGGRARLSPLRWTARIRT